MSSAELDLQLATNWMSTISLFIFISLGVFGCISNIIIFTSKQLKKNSCAFYFLCSSLFELFILCFGGISRLAVEHFGSTFVNQNRIFCKIRSYLITTLGTIATYLVLLAAIDRCMTTSVHVRYRAFSQIKIAHRVVLATIIFTMIINIHVLIFFDQSACIPRPGIYALFYSIYVIVWPTIVPDVLILIFTLWTFRNAKQLRLRMAANTLQQRSKQKIEVQLVIMMLAQASVSVFVDFTRSGCYAYYFLTTSVPKTPYEKVLAVFIFQFSNVLLYFNYAKSFYIYTLASSFFRKIFYEIIRNTYRKLFGILHKNIIHPVTIIPSIQNGTSDQNRLPSIASNRK